MSRRHLQLVPEPRHLRLVPKPAPARVRLTFAVLDADASGAEVRAQAAAIGGTEQTVAATRLAEAGDGPT